MVSVEEFPPHSCTASDEKLARESSYGEKGLFGDFKRSPGEGWLGYTKRLCSEGHSVPDAFLTVAASQVSAVWGDLSSEHAWCALTRSEPT